MVELYPHVKDQVAIGLVNEGQKCHCGHVFVLREPVYAVKGTDYEPNWGTLVYICEPCLKKVGLAW